MGDARTNNHKYRRITAKKIRQAIIISNECCIEYMILRWHVLTGKGDTAKIIPFPQEKRIQKEKKIR